ncbi:MAG TPA: DUF58 domain-containing protein [Candidatus Dormibacteraeota bacterium]|jgi:uncharacterized protein (DUF58 family)|nr:DUF58 domain-containing protein [Candidatus Dormibacteraeota bacterium]
MSFARGEREDPLGLGAELLARLDRLSVNVRRPVLGQAAGGRRSPRPGTSTEFADFRTYVPGDDFRRIDWNAYGRLDRLLLKLYLGEEDLALNVIVDVSASMAWGEPDKSTYARRLAGALAYVALGSYDRVSVAGLGDALTTPLPALRGRGAAIRLWRALAGLPGGGATDYAAIAASRRPLARGVTVLISDFLSDSDLAPALARLRRGGQEVALVQVLAPREVRPDLSGDIALEDLETGATVDLTVTPAVLHRYAEALRRHQAWLSALTSAHGASFHVAVTDQPLDALLLSTLRRGGVLR